MVEVVEWKEEKYGRLVPKNEIIIEDIDEQEIFNIAEKMHKQGNYNLEYWKAPKQTSGHLHIKFINLPTDIPVELANEYRTLIIKKYVREELWKEIDWNFYNRKEGAEPHRIVTEETNHYKGYGVKTLIRSWGEQSLNPVEEKILEQAKKNIQDNSIKNLGENYKKDYETLINKVIPHWKEGNRQNVCMYLAGYLRKEKRLGIETTKTIISEICSRAKDTELKMRLTAVEETYKKDEKDIKGISGLDFLKEEIIKEEGFAFSYFDNLTNFIEIAKQFIRIQPVFYDEAGLWWVWNNNEKKWVLKDEIDILNKIDQNTRNPTVNSKIKNELLEALKRVGRQNIPKPIKSTWVQFIDKIYDIQTGESFDATPEYFVTNPISWKISGDPRTPTMDRIFEEWVGKENVPLLHEILAYSILPDYPINRLFCFIGKGLNGKTKFLELLQNFVGISNICSTELDNLIHSRFEVTRLYKKLVCMMGETNFDELSKTSILKKLTGRDIIGFEYKNKTPFEDYNYAKIIIATNNLPTTTDKTIGFYRRWLIVDFPNTFSEKKDILKDIPEEEYNNLATNSIIILNQLLQKREFTNEGTVEERAERYEAKSNFLEKFIKISTEEWVDGYITKAEFIKKFTAWCQENRHRQLSDTTIGIKMKELGYESSTKHFDWMFDGKGGNAKVWLGFKWKN